MQNMMFLIVITDLHLGTKGKFAGICFNKTVDDLTRGSREIRILSWSSRGFSILCTRSSIFSRLSARLMDFSRLKDFSLAITAS